MTAVALTSGTADADPHGSAKRDALRRLGASALAGMALFGFVLDEYDAPHDNAQGFIVLGVGAMAGCIVGALFGVRPLLRESVTRVAWDAVRFVLAYEMVRYGVAKLIGMQFYPQYFRWDRRVVEQSPMALAWAFMGRTYGYQAFGGLIEVASGALVCFRRTTLLGACLMTAALLNVALIDFFYNVPVKLFASLYLLLSVALVSRDSRRLWAFFLLPANRATGGARGRWVYGIVIACSIVAPAVKTVREGMKHRVFEREPLEGAWSVEERSGDAPERWDRLYFEKDDRGFLRMGGKGGKLVPFRKQLDGNELRLSVGGATAAPSANAPSLDVRGVIAVDGRTLRFDGTCDGQPCSVKMTREFPP
jgi:hypothetical protein